MRPGFFVSNHSPITPWTGSGLGRWDYVLFEFPPQLTIFPFCQYIRTALDSVLAFQYLDQPNRYGEDVSGVDGP